MKSNSFFSLAIVLSVVAVRASAVELQSATVDAWQQYLRAADFRLQARLDSGKPFLWVDEAADRQVRVRRGEVVVAPLVRHGTQSVPNGLIHDWIGAVFIPNATVRSLLAVLMRPPRFDSEAGFRACVQLFFNRRTLPPTYTFKPEEICLLASLQRLTTLGLVPYPAN